MNDSEEKDDDLNKPSKLKHIPPLQISHIEIDYHSDPGSKYTLQTAKSFRHELKLNDPESIKKYNKFKKILNDHIKNVTFAPPSDDMIVILNQSLNRLTANIDVIHKNSEKLIHSYFFGTEKFISKFSEMIVESAVNQTAFVQVYTRFYQEIYIGLPTKEQKDLLVKETTKLIFDSPEKSIGKSFFIGSLLSAQILDYKPVIELVKKMLNMKQTETYETLFNLLIFAGPVLDEKYDNFEEDVVNELITAACNTDIKQRVRFLLSDLLDARADNWNLSSLLQNIVQIQETSKNQKIEKQKGKTNKNKTSNKKKQNTQANQFKPVVKEDNEKITEIETISSKDEEIEEDMNDIFNDSNLRSYILDNYIPKIWTKEYTIDIMVSLELSSMSDYEKGIKIFNEFKNDKQFITHCIECLREAEKKVNYPHIKYDFPYCVKTAGSIFAQLVTNCGIDPTIIGSSEFPFELDVFTGFLDELDRIGRLDVVENNEYFTSIKFKPQIFPHSQLLYDLSEMNLTFIFPLYDAMLTLFHMIEEEKQEDEIKKFINNDIDEKIAKNPMFIEFITEIIVIQRPSKYQCLLTFMARRPMETLAHIESLGEFYTWNERQVAAQIRKLSELIHADLQEFKKIQLRPFHQKVIVYLPSE